MNTSERQCRSLIRKRKEFHCRFRHAPEKIPGLIESNDAELRNQAGESIAVLYEIARDIQSVGEEEHLQDDRYDFL